MSDIDERFAEWAMRNNPAVRRFIELSLSKKRDGHKRYSADSVMHVLRWETNVRGDDGGFKWNNDYTSRLARMAMDLEPALRGFFQLRSLKRGRAA